MVPYLVAQARRGQPNSARCWEGRWDGGSGKATKRKGQSVPSSKAKASRKLKTEKPVLSLSFEDCILLVT